MSDTKISALTAATLPLDDDWLIPLAKGSPDVLNRRATLSQVRGTAGAGLALTDGAFASRVPTGDPDYFVLWTDFAIQDWWVSYHSGGNALVQRDDMLGGTNTGNMSFITGSGSTGRGALVWPTANMAQMDALQLGLGPVLCESRLALPIASDGTNTFAARAGLTVDPATSTPLDGLFFDYNPALHGNDNWWCVSRSNNTNRAVDSGVSAPISEWQTLRLEVNADATQVLSYIDDTLVDTNTTNVPSGLARRVGLGICIQKSAGTSTRSFFADYFIFKQHYTSGRPT